MQDFLAEENIKPISDAASSKFENSFAISDFQEKIKAVGNDTQALMNLFATDTNTKEYWQTLTTDADKYRAILSHITDEEQKSAVSKDLLHARINETQFSDESAKKFLNENVD